METNQNLQAILSEAEKQGVFMASGQNEYVTSLLAPEVPTVYPDDTYQTTFAKAIPLSQEFTVAEIPSFTPEFRIVMPAESPRVGLYVDRRHVDGTWYHEQFVQLAQDIQNPNRYAAYRTVSGYICLQSATLPSGQYAINGSLNAVKMSYAPSIFSHAGFDQLLPYKSSNSAAVLNVPVLDGVCMTYPYRGAAAFQSPVQVKGSTFSPSAFFSNLTAERRWDNMTEPQFFPTAGTTLFKVSTNPDEPSYDQSFSTFIKTYQTYDVCVALNPSIGTQPINEVRVKVRMPHIVDGVAAPYLDSELQFSNLKDAVVSVNGCFTFQAVGQITELSVYITGTRPTITRHFTVQLIQHSASSSAQAATLSVINAKGHDYSTVFRLFGQMNFEVEPGSDLRVDMQPSFNITHELADRGVARNILILIENRLGYDGISTVDFARRFFKMVRETNFDRKKLEGFQWMGSLVRLMSTVGRSLFKHRAPLIAVAKDIRDEVAARRHPRGYNGVTEPQDIPVPMGPDAGQWYYNPTGRYFWSPSDGGQYIPDVDGDGPLHLRLAGLLRSGPVLPKLGEHEPCVVRVHPKGRGHGKRPEPVKPIGYNMESNTPVRRHPRSPHPRPPGYNMMQGPRVRCHPMTRHPRIVRRGDTLEYEPWTEAQLNEPMELKSIECSPGRLDSLASDPDPTPEWFQVDGGDRTVDVAVYGFTPPEDLGRIIDLDELGTTSDQGWAAILRYAHAMANPWPEFHIRPIPAKKNIGYNMMTGTSLRAPRKGRAKKAIVAEVAEEQDLAPNAGTLPYQAQRKMITITGEGTPISTTMTVSTSPTPEVAEGRSPLVVTVKGVKPVKVHVYGKEGDVNEEIDYDDVPAVQDSDWRRLLAFGHLFAFGVHPEIYIGFQNQGLDLKGPSFSFALEAILLGLPADYHYCGDSDPTIDFLPEFRCEPGVIQLKAKLGVPTAFKCAWTAPDESDAQFPVPLLSEAMIENAIPHSFIVESSTPLIYLLSRTGKQLYEAYERPKIGPLVQYVQQPIMQMEIAGIPREEAKELAQIDSGGPEKKEKPKSTVWNPFSGQAAPEEKKQAQGSKKVEKKPSNYPKAVAALSTDEKDNVDAFKFIPAPELLWIGPAKLGKSLQKFQSQVEDFVNAIDFDTIPKKYQAEFQSAFVGLHKLVSEDMNLTSKEKGGVMGFTSRWIPLDPDKTRVYSEETGNFVPLSRLHPTIQPRFGRRFLSEQMGAIMKQLRGQAYKETEVGPQPYRFKKKDKRQGVAQKQPQVIKGITPAEVFGPTEVSDNGGDHPDGEGFEYF